MTRIWIPGDSAALALGADAVAEAIRLEAARQGRAVTIIRNGSRGMIWLEPLVEVEVDGIRMGFGPAEPGDAAAILAGNSAKALGPDVLNARLGAATRGFYAASSKYLTPQTAKGKAAIEAAWVDTLDAKVPPSKRLVLSF